MNTDDFEYYSYRSLTEKFKINIVVFDLSGITSIPDIIKYLINLNKKILIIADSEFRLQTNEFIDFNVRFI